MISSSKLSQTLKFLDSLINCEIFSLLTALLVIRKKHLMSDTWFIDKKRRKDDAIMTSFCPFLFSWVCDSNFTFVYTVHARILRYGEIMEGMLSHYVTSFCNKVRNILLCCCEVLLGASIYLASLRLDANTTRWKPGFNKI